MWFMSNKEDNQEVDSMQPKAMGKCAIMDLVKDLLAKANQAEPKSKKGIIEWGDESEEKDESLSRETSDKGKDPKVVLDGFKSLNKDGKDPTHRL